MQILQAIILGIAQGTGEFLPISSSGHLIAVPYLLNFKDPGLTFDVALHLATAIAVIAYFWKDWAFIIGRGLGIHKSNVPDELHDYPRVLLWFIVAATIPGAIAGYFLEGEAETFFRNPLILAATFSVFALILYAADRAAKHREGLSQVSFTEAMAIGFAQALAIVPGVSRSGITATAGMFSGLSREAAMRFSFLLSTPVILGAAVFKLKDVFEVGFASAFNGTGAAAVIVGFLTALLVGFISIKYLLRYLSHGSFIPFVVYRLILAAIIVIVFLTR